ncbi:MAG: hypothetical protein GY859_37675, partial [Desulfobacterales bacterium]|nr:hypothetical protein [Desulfobacterales bacterium]
SDHAPFKALGIPHAYFESTNWEIGDLDGYVQTVLFGEIWPTENDTMNFFASNYPGRIEEQMDLLMNVLDQLILSIDPPEAGTPAIREKGPSVRYTTRNGDPL